MSWIVGVGAKSGDRALSIARIPAGSVTTADFKWLHAEAWSDGQMAEFAELRSTAGPTALQPTLPWESGRRAPAPCLVGRWLLVREADAPALAAVEAVGHLRTFRTLHVLVTGAPWLVGPESGGGDGATQALQPLALIVTALMILARADMVVLTPSASVRAQLVAATGWGEVKRVWMPTPALLADAFEDVPAIKGAELLAIDPHAWWLTPHGASARTTLAYLEKRVDLEEREARLAATPRAPVGFFGRLGRLFRWS